MVLEKTFILQLVHTIKAQPPPITPNGLRERPGKACWQQIKSGQGSIRIESIFENLEINEIFN